MELITRLGDWFDERLEGVTCSAEAKAYVSGILAKYRHAVDDLSKRSIVLEYAEAQASASFEGYQRIGDWTLFVFSVYPQSLHESAGIVMSIGQTCYASCDSLMKGRWPVYVELAQELPELSRQVHRRLDHL